MDLHRINNLDELRELLDVLNRFDIAEFEIEAEGRTLRVCRGTVASVAPGVPIISGVAMVPGAAAAPHAVPPSSGARGEPSDAGVEDALAPGVKVVSSPMVGTFYRAPSPEADPFVQAGDRVTDDAALCIIEAMKVMNEIPSGISGVVKEVLINNGESVEFGQPLFHILAD